MADKRKPLQMLWPVTSVTVGGSIGSGHQTELFVIANGFDVHSGDPAQLYKGFPKQRKRFSDFQFIGSSWSVFIATARFDEEDGGLRNYNRSCWASRPDPDERRAPGPRSLVGNDHSPRVDQALPARVQPASHQRMQCIGDSWPPLLRWQLCSFPGFSLLTLLPSVQAALGLSRKSSPNFNTAQASRAFLAAMATTAFQ